MLSKIREKSTGIIAYIIVGLISVPFALWGINSYFEGASEVIVAEVDGLEINYDTYQNSLGERRRMMTQIMQQNLTPELLDSPVFKRQVVQELVRTTLESSHSSDTGYRISDESLGKSIRQLSYFQDNGAFSSQRYSDLVRNAGMSVAMFEQQQRQQIISQQIRSTYVDSAFVTQSDLDRVVALLEQVRQADYAIISSATMSVEDVKVADADISDYYEKNKERFYTNDEIRVSYVQLAVAEIAKDLSLEEAEVRNYYDENNARYKDPEERRVSHILITLPEDASDEITEEARSKAAELSLRASNGEDFAMLAKDSSDDTGSAAKGGDLGVLLPNQMVKPFEDAAYALVEAGDVSEPVRSRYGFHVIKLTQLVSETIQPFETARAEVELEMRERLAEEQFVESAESFANLVYEQPESLDAVEADLQLEIHESDWFSEGAGTGLASNPRFRRVAFSEEVRLEGLNSEAFELDDNTLVAMRKSEFRGRRLQEIDEVKEQIVSLITQKRLQDSASNLSQSTLEKLNAGGEWDSLVTEYGLESLLFDGTRNDSSDANSRALVATLFEAEKPSEGNPVYGSIPGVADSYLIFKLNSVASADPQVVDETRREQIRTQLQGRQGQDFFASYQDGLMKASDYTIHEDRL
ncbi:MAG: peptidyl-prolyl cis-trans isomerase D [Parasphingorhabdus sp.]|jgi:peptidyl-prolyl cis-trans isomerase D